MHRSFRTWQIAALLFGSGFCALVYQIAWLREFRLIFGASTAASSAVLAIFVGGLGLGSLILGPRADTHPKPLRFYAQLEMIVAVSAAVSPFLLAGVRSLYLMSGGSPRLGGVLAALLRLALSAAILAIPTFAMGGTLPAAARAATAAQDVRRRAVAVLYALNTLGAVAGTLIATFLLLERLGTRQPLEITAALNLGIAILASRLSERIDADDARTLTSDSIPARPPLPEQGVLVHPTPRPFLLLASGTVGFAFFLMELVWYRLLAPLLGGSVFTFGLVLGIALLGIGLGGLFYALLAIERPASVTGLATLCLLEAATVASSFALGDRIAIWTLRIQPPPTASFASNIVGWTAITALVVLPTSIVAGFQFPYLIALFGQGRDRLGRELGLGYLANTMGGMIGSLAGGFGFLPLLTAQGTWRLVGVSLFVLGVGAALIGAKNRKGRSLVGQAVIAASVVGLLLAEGPTALWRHSGIGARRAPPADVLESPNNLLAWRQRTKDQVIWDGDGTESGVALIADRSGYAFMVNGKSDGSARGDAGTQVMLGLVGAFKHPDPRKALVIGLGTGSSAGWLGALASLERLDVVELEPLILDVARACKAVNHDVLNNPKVVITIGDAREALLTSRERYDIIASEPSNPYRAGIASLFTLEFYRAASNRLTEDGVFVQWVQGYEIDSRTLRIIYATLTTVFQDVETWQTARGDFVLVGTRRARPYSVQTLRRQINEEPFKSALQNAWRNVSVEGVLSHYLASNDVARALAAVGGGQVNTDDRNAVEFGLARSVGRPTAPLVAQIRELAQRSGAGHPSLDDSGDIRWATVDTAWVSYNFAEHWFHTDLLGPADERSRQLALGKYFRNGDLAGARDAWRQQTGAPRDVTELAMVADLEAEAGQDAALPLIERLEPYQTGEAETLLATLRVRQGRLDDAAAAIERAFALFRAGPWALGRYQQKALDIAEVLAQRPSLTRRMFDALEQPFANLLMDEPRLTTRISVALMLPSKNACLAPVAAFETKTPWDEQVLRLRRDCYRATGDRRAEAAVRDLVAFLAHEPPSLTRDATTSSGQ